MDFRAHLARQLRFIRSSCESSDNGFTDEAIRIATSLRVMFHDTKSQMSLLTRLGQSDIALLSTVRPVGSGVIFFDGINQIAIGPSGGKVGPKLGNSSFKGFMQRADWWSQVLFAQNDLIARRRDIALAAANKDGGTHVDSKLTAEYEELQKGIWSLCPPESGEEIRQADSHYYRTTPNCIRGSE